MATLSHKITTKRGIWEIEFPNIYKTSDGRLYVRLPERSIAEFTPLFYPKRSIYGRIEYAPAGIRREALSFFKRIRHLVKGGGSEG